MAQSVGILVNQIAIMFVLMAVGFALFKLRILSAQGGRQLSNLVMYITAPSLVLRSLMREFDPQALVAAGWAALLTVIMTVIAIAIATLVFRDKERRHGAVCRFGVVFSNCGFMGIPIVMSVCGIEYVFHVSVAVTVQAVFQWTYGILMLSNDRSRVSARKILLNPGTVPLYIGAVCFAFSFIPPAPVMGILSTVGEMNTGLVMISLGVMLGQCDFAAVLRERNVHLVNLLRLVAVPVVMVGVLMLFPGLDTGTRIVVLVTSSAPVAAMTAMFSQLIGRDESFASGLVAFSTLLSVVTMPLVIEFAALVL